ncbi:hypothetical protein [Halodesulfovibrio marinisediminis]|uniref:Uncharacterized protein n=1 Tax=Halodesulfovibrio marinisediminis DSM 17456 TaxID=1121457 RepID=A0A1N6I8G9_9BACT|nr:hypothetical protein [Halodesulfovibrio marinisediminis]SIO28300.1 hypothetical protein SAMN02745161_2515 [Halodesulfovibrio marinisediminis DSM 17456]
MTVINSTGVAVQHQQLNSSQEPTATQQSSRGAGLLSRFIASLPRIRRQQGQQEVPRADLGAVKVNSASPIRADGPKPMSAGSITVPIPPENVHQRVDISSLTKGELRSVANQVRNQHGNRWEMSEAGQGMFKELATKLLSASVSRGNDVYQSVLSGEKVAANDETIKDLMTFLLAKGQTKSGAAPNSSFVIEDSGNRLKNFLDSSVGGYARTSPYAKEGQRANQHRGIDLSLPGGKGSLLYGALHDSTGAVSDRILLKMESHGAALSKLFNRNPEGGVGSRGLKFSDIGKLIKRSWAKVCHAGETGKREATIPSQLRKEFKELCHKAVASSPKLADTLNAGSPTDKETAVGLSRMYQNCKKALAGLEDMRAAAPEKEKIKALMHKLSSQYDNLDIRLGDEVALSSSELKPFDALNGKNTSELGNSLLQFIHDLPAKDTVTENDVMSFAKLLTAMEASIVIRPDDSGAADTFDRMRSVLDKTVLSFAEKNDIAPEALKASFSKLIKSDSMKAFMGDIQKGLENLDSVSMGAVYRFVAVAETFGFKEQDLLGGATGGFPNFERQLSTIDTLKSELGAKFMMREIPLELLGANGVGNLQKLSGNEFATVTDKERGCIVHTAGNNASEWLSNSGVGHGNYNVQSEVEKNLLEDLQTTPKEFWNPKGVEGDDLSGISRDFIVDFARDGLKVDGELIKPKSKTDEGIAVAYRKLIEVLGGPDRARLVTRVAYQNVEGILQSSWAGMDKPLNEAHMHLLQQRSTMKGALSISTQGDKYGITASSDQRTDDLSLVLTARFRVSFAGEAENNPVIERVTTEAALVDRPL